MEDGARTVTIAVIGAGPLGRRLALAFAQAGLRVVLEDVMPANLRHAEMELAQLDRGAENLSFATSIEAAVREADIAIDFVPDELESKLEIFCLLDRMAPPRTILCTPSRAMSITDLASCTYRAEHCVAVRGDAGNELALADAAEIGILRGPMTDDATVARVQEIFRQVGKPTSVMDDPAAPVLVKNAHLVRG
ncbi:MAG TPA: 3-hydroxyacyl-CoA dehydrogenase NAD-binding domain-containing protein [Acidobacteriaceae bacterium]